MKLLVVLPSYEPGWKFGSGVVSCMSALCRALAKLGVSVTVYATNASGKEKPLAVPLNQPVNRGGVTVYYFKSTFGPRTNFDSRQLTRTLRQTARDFDVVYVAALWQWIGIDTARICHKLAVPLLVGIHGGFSMKLRKKSYLKKMLFRHVLLRKALRTAKGIHVTCDDEIQHAGSWMDNLPIFIVPNAADPEKYYPCPARRSPFRNDHGIPKDAPVLISVGRPDWEKKIDLLVAALAQAPDWYFVFVGEHAHGKAPEWKQYAEDLGVSERIVWTGFLAGEDLLAALSAADLFALVSENENFGLVVVEAMLCGLPVLLSPDIGIYSMIKDKPFIMPAARSPDGLADSLACFQKGLRDSRFDAAPIRQTAIERFSPVVVARRFLSEVEKLLAPRNPSAREAPVHHARGGPGSPDRSRQDVSHRLAVCPM